MTTEEAIRKYCTAAGKKPPVNFVDFANWCAVNEPDFNEQLERHAARVLNDGTTGDTDLYVRRLTWEIEMRETHRKDLPWVKTNWGTGIKNREGAFCNLRLVKEMNRDSPYKPEFRLLELLTTIIEVKPS